MANVQWPLLVVILLSGVSKALLFTDEKSNENPYYGVRHHAVRDYESDGTLPSTGSHRYNAPPKDSAVNDKNSGEDIDSKKAHEKDKSTTKKGKSIGDVEMLSDKKDTKTKKSTKKENGATKKSEAANKDKNTKGKNTKGKSLAKEKKTTKEDKNSTKKDKGIVTGDVTTNKSSTESVSQTFVVPDDGKGEFTKRGGDRGGRNLKTNAFEKKIRLLELVITITNNATKNKTEPKPDACLVQNERQKQIIKVLKKLTYTVKQMREDYNSLFNTVFVADCSDIAHMINESSLQTFNLNYKSKRPVTVMCDMETDGGGWTVVQRRNGELKNVDFNRGWYEYKLGFGDPAGEYWVGLDNLYAWTNMRRYELRIELMDYEGNCKHALYKQFYLDDETQGYRLHVSGYRGNAGDALTRKNVHDEFTANGMMFTTRDRDNDLASNVNCAQLWKSGGWWYNRCSWANLNGPSWMQADGTGVGINWHVWRNKEHLKSAIMMIRPVGRE